MLGQVSSG